MEIIETDIKDVLVLRPRVFEDARGYFLESYNQEVFDRAVGRPIRFVRSPNWSASFRDGYWT